MNLWFSEYYPTPEAKLSIKIKDVLFTAKSEFQQIDIYQTERMGKLLVLDGYVMLSEMDEFVYHEMISHPAMLTHPAPKKVLIVGGGDGGTLREVLRHRSVETAYLVEIDEMVTKACLEHFPQLASSVHDKRVITRFMDAVEFVGTTNEKFDVILIDSTDPISIGEGLFTREFYTNCYNILNPDGILVAQSESAFYTPNYIPMIVNKIKAVFGNVRLFRASIPLYPSGDWYFTFASKKYDPVEHIDRQKIREFTREQPLKYYNEDIHFGAFAIPTFVTELVFNENR